jgi:hypothetical protein
MGQSNDGTRRSVPVLGTEEAVQVDVRSLSPGGEAVRGEQPVERDRQLRTLLGRIEGVELVHPELAERWVLHLAHEARKVDRLPG